MSKQTKSLVYNFLGFAIIYLVIYVGTKTFLTNITGFWIPLSSAVLSSFLAPKFQAVKTKDGEKLYMKSIFLKDIKEIK